MRTSQLTPPPSAKGANAGTVILNFSCKGLRDRDVLSKSDPQLILYTSMKGRANYVLVSFFCPSWVLSRFLSIFVL